MSWNSRLFWLVTVDVGYDFTSKEDKFNSFWQNVGRDGQSLESDSGALQYSWALGPAVED
jgi:hypothetical protein